MNQNTMSKTCSPKCQNQLTKAKKMAENTKIRVKKEKATDKKRFSRTNLVKEADRVFSIYIRERDKGKPCITCWKGWEENFQCGHLFSRRHQATRWTEHNAHWQCPWCNLYWAGEQIKHWIATNLLHWEGTVEQIMRLANDTSKTTDEEILSYIRGYYYELSQMWWTNEQIKIKKYYLN